MPPKAKLSRSTSHQKEDKSKRRFEDLIEPWYVTGWTSRDYGIDAVVETTSTKRNSEDLRVDSKYFFVQLKSTDKIKKATGGIAFSLPVLKINQWTSSNVPVLFVLTDLSTNIFYYLWMNDDLLHCLTKGNSKWHLQNTVTIKIPVSNTLCKDEMESIKEYLVNFKWTKSYIEPGKFFELKDHCTELLSQYESIATRFNFLTSNTAVNDLKSDIDYSIYRVAIAGLSRVGKSSIINCLLKRKVSPTGFFQTTSVPIQFIPGRSEGVDVYFSNGHSKQFPLNDNSIAEFASQEHNEDNYKQVKLLSISVSNQDLQRGISVIDIPGLDDPDDTIVEYTLNTLNRVNAIFYVIDTSPAENGGFIFKSDYKKHICSLGQSLDKIFLVFNKSDVLSQDKLELVKERVIKDLKKLNLYDKVADKIYFITTIQSKENKFLDSMQKLEADLWNFIINENKYGIVRLALISGSINKAITSLSDILKSRSLNVEEKDKLELLISDVQKRIPGLKKEVQEKLGGFHKSISHTLNLQKNEILLELETLLKNVSLQDNLPNDRYIRNFLTINLNKAIDQGNKEFSYSNHQLKRFIDNWIEDNLKAVRSMLSGRINKRTLDMSGIEEFESPEIDLSSAWGMGMLTYVAGFIFYPAIALSAGILGFIGNLIMSAESRRAKRILKIVEESRKRYNKSFDELLGMFKDASTEQSQLVYQYIDRKLNDYFSDIGDQINKLHEPISRDKSKNYKSSIEDLVLLSKAVSNFEKQLYSYKI